MNTSGALISILMIWTIFSMIIYVAVPPSMIGASSSSEAKQNLGVSNIVSEGNCNGESCANGIGGFNDNAPKSAQPNTAASGNTIINFPFVLYTIWNVINFLYSFATAPFLIFNGLGFPPAIGYIIGVPMSILYYMGWIRVIQGG